MICSRSSPSRRRPSPKRKNRVLRVALTGGIACGKSVVARILAEKGCVVYSADEAAHRLMLPGGPAWGPVIARFGRSILRVDGTIDRAVLGGIVFSDPESRRALESIVHPLVLADQEETARRLERRGRVRVFVVEAALTVEAGFAGRFDRIVVVHCRRAEQIKRLRERDGISRAAALRKIGAQMPMREKSKHADYAIDASGPLAETVEQAERLHAQLIQEAQLRRS